jgi:hypothetical protein
LRSGGKGSTKIDEIRLKMLKHWRANFFVGRNADGHVIQAATAFAEGPYSQLFQPG